MSRSIFIRFVALIALAAALMFTWSVSRNLQPLATAQDAPQLLDPITIPKYVEPLTIPPVMEPIGIVTDEEGHEITQYRIAVRQFQQQILPPGFPPTTVFGYGNPNNSASFNYPAFTVEARKNAWVQVEWMNQLVDNPESDTPQFLPHILPVDQTLHWANPTGTPDSMGNAIEPYQGPVPIVTHVHGAHVPAISDGFPEAWYLPNASNLPEGIVTQGSNYGSVQETSPGSAVFLYPNDQNATTLWYHDHTMGMTRLNVYAGMAGFWLLRDEVEDSLNLPGPAPALGDALDTTYYEVPIAIQDRSFYSDGSLFYPDSRFFFDSYEGPYFPETPVRHIWNPETFGNTIVVNGKTWPYLEVEPRLYRLRLLNGSNSRFLILKFDQELTFYQIGSDGGLLSDNPLPMDQLLMGPAERMDVIVDFSNFEPGDEILLLNLGPDEPFGGLPVDPEVVADPETTGQIMQFRVMELTDRGNAGQIPQSLPLIERLSSNLPERYLTLTEEMYMPADVPAGAFLGTTGEGALSWGEAITENPMVNDVESWNIVNLTGDAHPVHLHLVQFQIVERIPFAAIRYEEAQEEFLFGNLVGDPPDPLDYLTGDPMPPQPNEMGWKDTVIANPGEITRIIARFDLGGLYVWHCHIVEHEDNEMMRPFYVGEMPVMAEMPDH